MAVARVESLTKQLEDRKKFPSSCVKNGPREASMKNEIEQLEKELLVRYYLRNKTCYPCLHSLVKTEANAWEN